MQLSKFQSGQNICYLQIMVQKITDTWYTAASHCAFSSHNFFSVLRRHAGLNERHISACFIPAIFRSGLQQYERNLFYSNQSQLYMYKHRWCQTATSFYILAWQTSKWLVQNRQKHVLHLILHVLNTVTKFCQLSICFSLDTSL